jgi:phosphate transport system substrate-binding protein
VKAYIDFYVENLADVTEIAQFVPLSDDQTATLQATLDGLAG